MKSPSAATADATAAAGGDVISQRNVGNPSIRGLILRRQWRMDGIEEIGRRAKIDQSCAKV